MEADGQRVAPTVTERVNKKKKKKKRASRRRMRPSRRCVQMHCVSAMQKCKNVAYCYEICIDWGKIDCKFGWILANRSGGSGEVACHMR